MHSTLTPKGNFKLIAVYFICIVILIAIYKSSILYLTIIGLLLGVPAGYLQLKALSANWNSIRHAKTMIEIRRSLLKIKYGKWFYYYYYFAVGLGFLISYGFTKDNIKNLPLFCFATFFAIILARDLITLPFIINPKSKDSELKGSV